MLFSLIRSIGKSGGAAFPPNKEKRAVFENGALFCSSGSHRQAAVAAYFRNFSAKPIK